MQINDGSDQEKSNSMIHASLKMFDSTDQIVAYLDWNQGRTPCKQAKSSMLNKYLKDYTICVLRDTREKSDGITTSHSVDKSILPSQSKKQSWISINLEPIRRILQTRNTPPINSRITGTMKVGKMLARESGLFNKGRKGKPSILEELGRNKSVAFSI